MDSEKLMNLFQTKKGRSPDYLLDFFYQFINNF